MNNRQLGIGGESIACEYLENKGYKIIERNYSCKLGEIDLIVRKGNILAFVEVKARDNTKFGLPIEAITKSKVGKIVATAKLYLVSKKINGLDIRFDVINILRGNIEHIEDCFRP